MKSTKVVKRFQYKQEQVIIRKHYQGGYEYVIPTLQYAKSGWYDTIKEASDKAKDVIDGQEVNKIIPDIKGQDVKVQDRFVERYYM